MLKNRSETFTIASGGTSGYVEIGEVDEIVLLVPTLTSSTLKINGGEDIGLSTSGVFDVYDGGGTQVLSWAANTGVRSIGARALSDVIPFKYLVVVCGTAQGGTRTFTLLRKAPKRL